MPDTKRKAPPAPVPPPGRVTVKAASGFYETKGGRYVRTGEVVELDAVEAAGLIALNMARVHAPARG
jgi:hypothetical protein